jgi:hypothetical protein
MRKFGESQLSVNAPPGNGEEGSNGSPSLRQRAAPETTLKMPGRKVEDRLMTLKKIPIARRRAALERQVYATRNIVATLSEIAKAKKDNRSM